MIKKIKLLEETRVLIGQPLDYPDELINLLIDQFNSVKCIKYACLACVRYPNSEEPHLVVALDTIHDIKGIVISIKNRLDSLSLKVGKIDFIRIEDSPLKNYFSKIKPFYIG